MRAVRAANSADINTLQLNFDDDRLNKLLPLYKMRNFPPTASDDDRAVWESYRQAKLIGTGAGSRAEKFFKRLSELAEQPQTTENQRFLLEELQLYGQSILPEPN
jgi:exodeoxyribonuclease-1